MRTFRERLEQLEANSPDELAALIRERLRNLGVGDPDPMDEGTRMLVENILETIRR